MLETAKKYISKGVSVIPVKADKRPALESWKEYQSRLATEEELVKWFSATQNGIGIVTGKLSNLSVVDVDVKNGGTPKGLPPTLTAKTQSGGWHFYYRYLEGLPNKAGIRQGIDIRSDGGYVVAPPSKGEKGNYEWTLIEEPQPFPADVLQVEIGKSSVDWKTVAEGVEKGNRNETAAKFIGKLLASFKREEWESAVWLTVLNWNRANTPPLPERELRAVFNSIASRETKKQASEKEDDAPVVLMSEAAKKFTTDLSVAYPTGFIVLDTALGGGFRDGNLVLVVGETGHGKSLLARTLTYNLLKKRITSVWFTFELTIQEMWEKFLEMGKENEKMVDASPVYTPERNVSRKLQWLKKKIVEAREQYKCKIVFIDHLGFLLGEYDGNPDTRGLSNSLATVIGLICRDLKTIAIQESVVIVLLWHLKKLSENKREPDNSDIKDSSGVAQESDVVISISREKLSTKGYVEDVDDVFGKDAFVKMIKNRRTGVLKRFKVAFVDGCLVEPESVKQASQADKDFEETW